jgi:hypothetical protein
VDELAAVRKRLQERIGSVQVRYVPGLSDDLAAMLAAFGELERRTASLAAFALRSDFGVTKHRAQLEGLAKMGHEPETVLRVFQHGQGCTCADCMRNR